MKRRLLPSPAFLRSLKRLRKQQPATSLKVHQALDQLEADALHPRLRTHKLQGYDPPRWSCTAGYDRRIVFRFVEHEGIEAIYLLNIGTHDEVY